jgi:2-oxoglutarate ferredoxin oxidoreductase subunit gamma
MMNEQIIVAGFGGQGVLSLGKMLAEAAMEEGREVTWLPAYGPEMRGGTSNCTVIVSDEEIGSPATTRATCVIAMNGPSLDKFENTVIPGGLLLINSSLIERKSTRDDINVVYVPVNQIAEELGNTKAANMVMLGAFLAKKPIVKPETVIDQLRALWGEKKAHLIPLNQKAIEKGAESAK